MRQLVSSFAFTFKVRPYAKRDHLTIKNVSSVPCRYQWVFVVDADDADADASEVGETRKLERRRPGRA